MSVITPACSQYKALRCRQGMATVIALVLMAFIVTLALALSASVRVETNISAVQTQQLHAKNNALLGLTVAMGELQDALGPDRRVSATADILTEAQPHRGRNDPVDVTQNHWTGVWNTEGGLRTWLVSGNEATVTPADLHTSANPAVTPDGVLVGNSPDLDATGQVSMGGRDALVLVAKGSVGAGDQSMMVVAPEVEVGTSGGYAWWIGDEGVKARVNSVDSYVEDGESSSPARHLSAQRNAVELLSGLETFDDVDGEALDRLSSSEQIKLVLPNVSRAVLQSHFHDMTLWSKGLLTDVRNGGLKRDLTYLFELNDTEFSDELAGLYADTGFVLEKDDEGTTPIAQMAVTSPDWYFDANPNLDADYFEPWELMNLPFGATWEQMRSFYRLKEQLDTATNSIAIRPQREDQAGVYPILLQARVFSGISRVMSGMGGDALPNTDDDEMEVFAHFRILFVLANPYAVDLDISNMNFTFYMRGGDIPVSFNSEVFGSWRELFNHRRFHISSGIIPAGEARVFTLDRSVADVSANASYPFISITPSGFTTNSNQPALVTHELTNDFDEFVSLRCQLPGGPYTRSETDNAYLEAGTGSGGSDGVVITWAENPTDYRDVLQFSGSIGSGNTDVNTDTPERFSSYIDPLIADGQVAWGGGSRWLMTDVSRAGSSIGNYIREVIIRAPYRTAISDAYSPAPNQNTGGQFFPVISTGVTRTDKFGAEELLYLDSTTSGFKRAGWGMLYAPYDGQDPHLVNHWFYIPTPDAPLSSLGQLQHFNVSGYIPSEPASNIYNIDYSHGRYYYNNVYKLNESGLGYDDFPTLAFSHEYAIGNSFSSRYVERDRVYNGGTLLMPRDASWLLNAALWDRFYFSSLPQSGSFDSSTDKLLNNRYRPIDDGRGATVESLRSSPTAFAEHMCMAGGFNVNSTSKDAWKAFLAGTLGVDYQGVNHNDSAVFARTPSQATNPDAGGDPKDPLTANAWKGYRALTVDEIDVLAEKVVEQVKRRGPFLSLEHFVNRLPIAAADDDFDIGVKGALEAAIENAELNPKANVAADSRLRKNNEPTAAVDLEHGYETLIEGGPGQITQGDLLQPLGPYISVRSDTFLIRSTGVYRDPLTGEHLSQAWCEAVVQRTPDFVDDSQPANSSLVDVESNPINLKLGRRFEMVSFRWLDPDEI